MKRIVLALAVFLLAWEATAQAEIGFSDPSGWYLEGPGARLGPFGSAGLCIDLRNRQAAAERFQCVQYDRGYWLVDGSGGRAVASMPFASLDACRAARTRMLVNSTADLVCTRRAPASIPAPGTASVPGAVQTAGTLARW